MCRRHQSVQDVITSRSQSGRRVTRSQTTKAQTTKAQKREAQKPEKREAKNESQDKDKRAYFESIHISNDLFLQIQSLISDKVVSKLTEDQTTRGNRQLTYVNKAIQKKLIPLLLEVVKQAQKEAGFPIRGPNIQKPSLVVAPRVTNHSTAWTKGKVHRDFEDFNWKGVYSFMLFLDEVNVDNGAIEFWPKSKQMPVDKQNPERTLKMTGWTSEIVTGPKATVMAWDAFVLHRSLPNKTEKQRLTLQWFVTTMRGPTIIFA
jgi:hypothetical protein